MQYSVLYAEDVPHYAEIEIDAPTPEHAIQRAQDHDFNDEALEAEWESSTSRRIVRIQNSTGEVIASDLRLDSSFLSFGDDRKMRICDFAEEVLEALKLGFSKDWVHNAGITDDIEALRAICLAHSNWWNNIALPLIKKLEGASA